MLRLRENGSPSRTEQSGPAGSEAGEVIIDALTDRVEVKRDDEIRMHLRVTAECLNPRITNLLQAYALQEIFAFWRIC